MKTQIEEIRLEVTSRCNKHCSFCFGNKDDYEPSLQEIKDRLDYIKKNGIRSVRITGGEPLLRKDIEEILRYAGSLGLYTILNTNGSMQIEHLLNYVDDVLISLHTPDENMARLVKNIKDKNPKKIFRFCTIATEENIEKLEQYYALLKDSDIDDWFVVRPIGLETKKAFAEKLIEKIIKNNTHSKVKCHIANSMPFCVYKPIISKDVCLGNRNDLGRTRLVIDIHGNIKADYFSQEVIGTLEKNLGEIDYSAKLNDFCRLCFYYDSCLGALGEDDRLIEEKNCSIPPSVSVVIPTYNCAHLIKKIIKNIECQDYALDKIELIIADDGSKDNIQEQIEKTTSKIKIKFVQQKDLGFRAGQARNMGASIAENDILVFLDSDIVPSRSLIKAHVSALKTHDISLGYSSGYMADKSHDTDSPDKIIKEFRHYIFLKKYVPEAWQYFVSNNFAIKRHAFLNQMFDERFVGWGEEDTELGYRLKDKKIIFNINALGYHIGNKHFYDAEKVSSLTKNLRLFSELHDDEEVKRYIIERLTHLPEKYRELFMEMLSKLKK